MNEIKVFENRQFGQLRTVIHDGELWWVLKDACDALGLSDTGKVAERLDEDELTRIKLVSGGQNREMYVINESGLYNVILRSDKPEAKAFKRWVTREIIPTIRKYGGYLTSQKVEEVLLNPDTIIRLATDLKMEREEKQRLALKVEKDAPKVLFADSVAASENDILVGELAKILKQNDVDIGQNRLFKQMRKDGYLISRKGADWNMPTQKSMEMGLMRIKETAITHGDGHITTRTTPKVTGKGQVYFVNRYGDAANS